jgi:predicted TIM-barrel fold metal-dependent hydrolase
VVDFKLLSADCHVVEHPDAFARVQKEFPERAPRVVEDPQGLAPGLWFMVEGLEPMHVGYFALGHVIDKPEGRKNIELYQNSGSFKKSVNDFVEGYRYENFREDWEPDAYLKALDRDNVEATIIYASWARYNYAQDDAKFQRSILNSYNEWMFETFASHSSKRFHPAPMISILDVDLAIRDMEHFAKKGAKTFHIPTTILDSGYYEKKYEPLWAKAVELDLPISVHANSSQGRPMKLHGTKKREFEPEKFVINSRGAGLGGPSTAWEFISNLMFSGVWDRYPSLKVGVAEFKMDDAAHTFEMIDYEMGRLATYDPERNTYKRRPSDYLKDNVFISFEESRAIVLTAPLYGADNYMWGSDFPHFQSVWPYSKKLVEGACEGLDAATIRKLTRDNVNKIYRLV